MMENFNLQDTNYTPGFLSGLRILTEAYGPNNNFLLRSAFIGNLLSPLLSIGLLPYVGRIRAYSNTLLLCRLAEICCRICLQTDCKLLPLKLYGLSTAYYIELMEMTLLDCSDGLPQELCVECATLVLKYHTFRDNCRKAYKILYSMKIEDGFVLKNKIKEAKREEDNLQLNLMFCPLISHIDIPPESNSKIKNIETKIKQNRKNIHYHDIEIDYKEQDNVILITSDSSVENNEITHSYSDEEMFKTKPKIIIPKTIISKEVVFNSVKKIETEEYNNKPCVLLNYDQEEIDRNNITNLYKRRKDGKIMAPNAIRNIIIKQKRDALLNESFEVKTLTSIEEQQHCFEKLKLDASYVNALFKCEMCFKGLVNERYLKSHFKRFHSKDLGKFSCQLCKKRFRIRSCLLYHIRNMHLQEYQCKFCDSTFTDPASAESHAMAHKKIKFICQHCGQEYERQTVYLSHLRIKHPSDDVCVHCGYSFIGVIGLNAHIKRKHPEALDQLTGPSCDSCKIQFASEEALQVHIGVKHPLLSQITVINDRQRRIKRYKPQMGRKNVTRNRSSIVYPVPCESCGLKLFTAKEYRKHFHREHPHSKREFVVSKYYQNICEKCGRGFHAKSLLHDHLLTHGSELTVSCVKCDRKFKSVMQMKLHLSSHEKPIECPICGTNITKKNMKRHIFMKHTEGKNFQCTLCDKRFKTKGEVTSHTKYVHMKVPWPKKKKTSPNDRAPTRKRRTSERRERGNETEDSENYGYNDSKIV